MNEVRGKQEQPWHMLLVCLILQREISHLSSLNKTLTEEERLDWIEDAFGSLKSTYLKEARGRRSKSEGEKKEKMKRFNSV